LAGWRPGRRWLGVLLAVALAACGSGSSSKEDTGFVTGIRDAVEAVEAELGGPQQYFEVTATPQSTNVFVAVDGVTAAIPYVYLDGQLLPPGDKLTGASGFTFGADAIAFDEKTVLSQVVEQLPDATITSFSVEGGQGGAVQYVASTRSSTDGGVLDITVGPDGTVVAVDPG
jgi:hypothetical protein